MEAPNDGCAPGIDLSPHLRPVVYLTGDVPGTGGQLKQRPEDFIVEEIPAYEPCGSGEHIYLYVQKVGLSTLQMVSIIARHFRVRQGDVGYAGLKDKRAVTRQVVSVHAPGKVPENFPSLKHDRVSVLWVDLHTNKLRRGHLKGNRFALKIRGVGLAAALHAKRSLDRLAAIGVPNRAGEQRFGLNHNNHIIGRAIVKGEWQTVLDEMLGPAEGRLLPGSADPPHQVQARRLYQEKRFAEAASMMPPGAEAEKRVLEALARGASAQTAAGSIGAMQCSFYLSSLQSAVFNAVLDERLKVGTINALAEGDLAFKHDNHAVFMVDAEALAQPELCQRLRDLEVSPSGPMWGDGMLRAGGAAGELEERMLGRAGLCADDLARFAARVGAEMKGNRRALRVPLMYPDVEGGSDENGVYVKCSFELPPGSFATTVMQEVMKGETENGADHAGGLGAD